MEKQTLFFSLLVFPSQLWSGFEVFSITSHSNNKIWVRFSFLHPFSPPKPLFLCLTIHIVLLVFFFIPLFCFYGISWVSGKGHVDEDTLFLDEVKISLPFILSLSFLFFLRS